MLAAQNTERAANGSFFVCFLKCPLTARSHRLFQLIFLC